MKKNIDPRQLFLSGQDIRRFLSVSLREEDRDWLLAEYDLTELALDAVLAHATIYVQMDRLPETLEVEEEPT